MTEAECSKFKAKVDIESPAPPDCGIIPGGVTSVAIAAEAIGEDCGLGNYLACLRLALDAQCGDHRQLRVLGTPVSPPRSQLSRLRRAFGRILRPISRRAGTFDSAPQRPAWAVAWRALNAKTVCLLPHVVCQDRGAFDDYYSALSARRLVWVVHDLHPLHFPDQWDPQSVEVFLRRCQLLSACARRIIVHNEYTKADACQKLGADRAKIVVARLPSILPECKPEALPPVEKTLHKLGIRRPYALWASSSTFGHKNHDRLLRAWRMLRERGEKIQLVCTGSKGPRWADLERLIRDLGLQDCVVFTGTVARESMWVVLANARMAVCPTLFEGGGSGPVAEAIRMRVPVACARIPQIQEQFGFREEFCEWFDPLDDQAIANAVATLLNNPRAALDRAQHAATAYPTLRSWEEVASVYWKTLDAAARDDLG